MLAASPDPFETLIASLYEGLLEPVLWSSFLRCFRESVQAMSVGLILRPPSESDRGLVIEDGFGAEQWEEHLYRTGYFYLDPFVGLAPGEPMTVQELIPTEELIRSDIYRIMMEPMGILYGLGFDVCTEEGVYAGLRAGRPVDSVDFGEAEKALCRRLGPHLQRAIRIHAKLRSLESQRDLYANTVDQFSVGTILLDERGSVLQMNQVAESFLAQHDGLTVRDGVLQAASPKESKALKRLIDRARSHLEAKAPGLVEACQIERPSGKNPLGLLIRPISFAEETDRTACPRVAIFINPPYERSTPSPEMVQKIFPFTNTEARVASLLAGGMRVEQVASSLDISVYTVKAHLRSIFFKTGVTRQAELVRLVLTSIVNLG